MSKIEQILNELEEFIDGCRFQPLSNTKIVVNKDELIDFISDLRQNIPDEEVILILGSCPIAGAATCKLQGFPVKAPDQRGQVADVNG
mgnify:CR=1 FL=1